MNRIVIGRLIEWMQSTRDLDSRKLKNCANSSSFPGDVKSVKRRSARPALLISPRLEIRTILKLKSKARGCAVKKSKARRDTVSPFRDKLWNLFQALARGMDGADVVVALKQAGEEIWAVGIDDTYSSMSHQDDEPLGNAFDITWLTIVCIKLKEMKQGKKPKVRIHP